MENNIRWVDVGCRYKYILAIQVFLLVKRECLNVLMVLCFEFFSRCNSVLWKIVFVITLCISRNTDAVLCI